MNEEMKIKGENVIEHTVDVIIPTYFPGKKLDELLKGLSLQSHAPRKIIIVNTEEKGFNSDCLKDYENIEVHHIRKSEFDHGRSRNLGVSFSKSEYFLCMTDDAVPADEYLIENLLKAMNSNERIATVYGRQLATKESSFDEQFSRRFNYPEESFTKGIEDLEKRKIKTYFQSNVCCLYKRDVFDTLGGFDTPAIFNEDMLYCAKELKAGYLSAYEANARVYHAHHYTGMQQLHRNFDLGVSQADHPEVFSQVPSEGEGVKMIFQNMKALAVEKRFYLIPLLIYRSACKYLGYKLGRNYKKLPVSVVKSLSMNREYWRRQEK